MRFLNHSKLWYTAWERRGHIIQEHGVGGVNGCGSIWWMDGRNGVTLQLKVLGNMWNRPWRRSKCRGRESGRECAWSSLFLLRWLDCRDAIDCNDPDCIYWRKQQVQSGMDVSWYVAYDPLVRVCQAFQLKKMDIFILTQYHKVILFFIVFN